MHMYKPLQLISVQNPRRRPFKLIRVSSISHHGQIIPKIVDNIAQCNPQLIEKLHTAHLVVVEFPA